MFEIRYLEKDYGDPIFIFSDRVSENEQYKEVNIKSCVLSITPTSS